MGKVISTLERKARHFNVENRAMKVISKEKRPTAKRPGSVDLDSAAAEHKAQVAAAVKEKDARLEGMLKGVYLTSTDAVPDAKPAEDAARDVRRPLPTDRSPVEQPEWGYAEPKTVPPGRLTLRQAVAFLTAHQADPRPTTLARLAADRNLGIDAARHLVAHFRIFEVYVPDAAAAGGGRHLRVQDPLTAMKSLGPAAMAEEGAKQAGKMREQWEEAERILNPKRKKKEKEKAEKVLDPTPEEGK
ncbi:PREDICTED: protein NDUFAF4 homolog [Priapulus caudatus]|uniref:Protein NDUFAF4 homolog n=1 Tax=Priapulus caudatus TaxID=37621 RepID=A0ABM1F007_PRICU|nr:PREDICTED: protein NDUFAF4 homolog [Priapulus caudatus]